ncbi:MAG TPA: hypothetical protein VF789_26770 [Thermoanaerobaculia bacterium]
MSWDSKLSYPPDADRTVSVRATANQKGCWTAAARRRGLATPGAFLAWAGDVVLALERAYENACLDHSDALNPVGYAEERRRMREREEERAKREAE